MAKVKQQRIRKWVKRDTINYSYNTFQNGLDKSTLLAFELLFKWYSNLSTSLLTKKKQKHFLWSNLAKSSKGARTFDFFFFRKPLDMVFCQCHSIISKFVNRMFAQKTQRNGRTLKLWSENKRGQCFFRIAYFHTQIDSSLRENQ